MLLTSNNMHYKFKKEYFDKTLIEDSKNDKLETANKDIYDHVYPKDMPNPQDALKDIEDCYSFTLYTTYPGLMVGTGELHSNSEKEAIVGGFTFDYATGLPTIAGSSLKGVLRSYFESKNEEIEEEKHSYIRSILNEDESLDVNALMQDIFEHQDVFIGGYPVVGADEHIFNSEYITPHIDFKTKKPNPLKNPIPVKMMKVRPGVEYHFYFILHDYEVDGKVWVSKEKKQELFKQLLLLGGVGAKTNVGFGQFSEENTVSGNTKTTEKNYKEAKVYSVTDYAVFLSKETPGIEANSRILKKDLGMWGNKIQKLDGKRVTVQYLKDTVSKKNKTFHDYKLINVLDEGE